MSRILSRISMFTGQISSHALHDVHAHSSSAVIRSNSESAPIGDLAVDADRRRDGGRAGRVHHLADLQHDLAGVERLAGRVRRADRRAPAADRARVGVEELLPREVFDRGHAERLELGLHQVRHGLHRALGPVLVAEVHVHRRRDHVAQLRRRQDHEERDERDEVRDPHPAVEVAERRCAPAVEQARERVADEGPLLERGAADAARCGSPRS